MWEHASGSQIVGKNRGPKNRNNRRPQRFFRGRRTSAVNPEPSEHAEAMMSYTQPTDRKGHEHVAMEDARAGETTGRIRIVLVVSSILAIVALGIVLIAFVQPAMHS
jgi:hypothetical protein